MPLDYRAPVFRAVALRAKNIANPATAGEPSRLVIPTQRNTVHVVVFSALIRFLERSGYSLEAFGRLSGISAEVPKDPDARVSIEVMLRSWKAALEITGNHALGLAIGSDYSSNAHGVLGHLISHSETLGDALRVLCRFQALLSGGNAIEITEKQSEAAIVFNADEPNPVIWPTVVERTFASLLTVAKDEAVGQFSLTRAEFNYSKPSYASAYRKFFGGPCRFDAKTCRLIFPRAHLGLAMRHRHSALHAILSREAETMRLDLNEPKGSTSANLLNALPNLLDRGVISARSAAEALNLSERTLHRRLSHEGVSYLKLLDKARLERALRLIAIADVSLEEVALACGFLENSGFYRAFKRWTGMAPRTYRQSHRTSTPAIRQAHVPSI